MIEHVYGIIDSKIQFMDFQINEMIKTKFGRLPESVLEGLNYLPDHLAHLSYDEKVLAALEAYSRNISLLLLMRTTLSYVSAETAFYLLSNDKYLDFTEEQLRTILEEALYNQSTKDMEEIVEKAMKKLNLAS